MGSILFGGTAPMLANLLLLLKARSWNPKGIKCFMDIIDHNTLISWDIMARKFELLGSQFRTYNLINNACAYLNLPIDTAVDSRCYLSFTWRDGSLLTKIKAKNIYKLLNVYFSMINHINKVWYCNLSTTKWQKVFDIPWKSPIPPKVKCFKWQLILDKLPVRTHLVAYDIYALYARPLKP